MTGLPKYVWRLFEIAKFVALPPVTSTPEYLAQLQQRLKEAVIEFERQMPVDGSGECVVSED